MPRPYILDELTWKAVRDLRYDVAVLPWGATEAHNLHLPYATDNIQAEELAARAAERAWNRGAKVVVLPVVPFGVNTGQLDIPLCVNMNPSTQALVLRDVAMSLAGQGIAKLVIFNGHGANDFRQMIRELQPQVSLFLCVVNWFKVVDPKPFFTDLGDHAAELETSVMQHVASELVLPLSEAGSGSDAFALTTRASQRGDEWILTGRKLWITNGNEADLFIVFATVNPEAGYRGITAFLVERGLPGFSVGKKEDERRRIPRTDGSSTRVNGRTRRRLPSSWTDHRRSSRASSGRRCRLAPPPALCREALLLPFAASYISCSRLLD